MKARITNPNDPNYHHYGGRDITLCTEWRESFAAFQEWAIANGYAEGLTIERTNTDEGYNPDNCKWVPQATQLANRRKHKGAHQYIGVTPADNKWLARVNYQGKRLFHERFDTEMVAVLARDKYIRDNGLPHRLNITE